MLSADRLLSTEVRSRGFALKEGVTEMALLSVQVSLLLMVVLREALLIG